MLLFKGNGLGRAFVRTITAGNFDHVGMIFKNQYESRERVTFVESV